MTNVNFSRETIEQFKSWTTSHQRSFIGTEWRWASMERMMHALSWADDYATDLIDPTKIDAKIAFDLWFIVTQVYDVDLPNDVAEIIAEEFAAGRGMKSARPWRNFLTRNSLNWRKFTKKDLAATARSGWWASR